MNDFVGKTLLVTGATGFVGSHLVSRLCRDGNVRLVLLARKRTAEDHQGVTWVSSALDQLTPATWREAGVERIDLVFHLGAYTPKSSTEADRVAEIYRDNLLGTRTLLESFPNTPERVIFASSIDVYAAPTGKVLEEDSPLGANGLYGASKLFCEQLVRVYAKTYGFAYAILRYGHIFGTGEEAYGKLIPLMIRRLLQGESPVLYGDGSVERDFLYVEDAVEATLRAALSDRPELGPVNVVRGESVTLRKIAEMLVMLTGFAGQIKYLVDKPAGYSLRFDNRLMQELLGTWDFISLKDGLKREVDYFRRLHQ